MANELNCFERKNFVRDTICCWCTNGFFEKANSIEGRISNPDNHHLKFNYVIGRKTSDFYFGWRWVDNIFDVVHTKTGKVPFFFIPDDWENFLLIYKCAYFYLNLMLGNALKWSGIEWAIRWRLPCFRSERKTFSSPAKDIRSDFSSSSLLPIRKYIPAPGRSEWFPLFIGCRNGHCNIKRIPHATIISLAQCKMSNVHSNRLHANYSHFTPLNPVNRQWTLDMPPSTIIALYIMIIVCTLYICVYVLNMVDTKSVSLLFNHYMWHNTQSKHTKTATGVFPSALILTIVSLSNVQLSWK